MHDRFKNKVEEFSLSFDSLDISTDDIKYGMGHFKDEIPEPFFGLIKQNLSCLSSVIDIKGGYCIFDDVIIDSANSTIHIEASTFHIGKIIAKQMEWTESVAVFVCTIGTKIKDLSDNLMRNDDMLQAYVVDTIGSVAVERAMDTIQRTLVEKEKSRGRNITNRFSPGYCNWPLTAQQALFALIPENFCSVKLTKSSLMIPIKSVSGIIGIGKNTKSSSYPCKICNMVECFRREKRSIITKH